MVFSNLKPIAGATGHLGTLRRRESLQIQLLLYKVKQSEGRSSHAGKLIRAVGSSSCINKKGERMERGRKDVEERKFTWQLSLVLCYYCN